MKSCALTAVYLEPLVRVLTGLPEVDHTTRLVGWSLLAAATTSLVTNSVAKRILMMCGWERAQWFGAPGTSPAHEYSFGREAWFERVADECRAVRELAKRKKVATQMGTQIHAGNNYRRVVELIQGGVIGPVTEAHVWVSRAWGLQSKEAADLGQNGGCGWSGESVQSAADLRQGAHRFPGRRHCVCCQVP